ncbi:serine/threonine protein kinase, FIKK family, putative [Plasmodium gaboni]|uniref:Serine/threonine protein kinase, FIKK family, putative n=1 Tax=Plasmodium gaboni TaxID=647221 RepID=A0ABY0KW98_9APIC|nr:serine/threonine protein kinase, FIKK family, putative [Plasmodium gaboni]
MRLCDFSKSTPKYSYYLRNIKEMKNLCFFEFCVPSVGKTRYIPPESIWHNGNLWYKSDTLQDKDYLKY